jgi:hypothetical protein
VLFWFGKNPVELWSVSPGVQAALRGFYVSFRGPSGRTKHNVQNSNHGFRVPAAPANEEQFVFNFFPCSTGLPQ